MPRVARRDAREPLDTARKMLVGVRPVDDPPAISRGAARRIAPAAMELGQIGIFGANEMELGPGGKLRARRGVMTLEANAAEALRKQDARYCEKHCNQARTGQENFGENSGGDASHSADILLCA